MLLGSRNNSTVNHDTTDSTTPCGTPNVDEAGAAALHDEVQLTPATSPMRTGGSHIKSESQVITQQVFPPLPSYAGQPAIDLWHVGVKFAAMDAITNGAEVYNWGFVRGIVPSQQGPTARVCLVLQLTPVPELQDKHDMFVHPDSKAVQARLNSSGTVSLFVVGVVDTGVHWQDNCLLVPVQASAATKLWLTAKFGEDRVGQLKADSMPVFDWQPNNLFPVVATDAAEVAEQLTVLKVHVCK